MESVKKGICCATYIRLSKDERNEQEEKLNTMKFKPEELELLFEKSRSNRIKMGRKSAKIKRGEL